MSNKLETRQFVFKDNEDNKKEVFDVRTITINDVVWWVAKDVASALDYSKTSRLLPHVDQDDQIEINPKEHGAELVVSFGSNTFRLSLINESGLYAAIFGSDKKRAKEFKRWVTSVVLPEIRRTGLFDVVPFQLSSESKIVFFERDDYWVLSTNIADIFGKQHSDVTQDLKAALSEVDELEGMETQFKLPEFKLIKCLLIDSKRCIQQVFKVNRSLFNYVVLAYQEDNNKYHRMRFIAAFEELEKESKVFITQQLLYEDPKRQQVYVFKNPVTNFIKIGISNAVKRRKRELENASGIELEVAFTAPLADNSAQIEKELHQKFAEFRGVGEWFDLNADVVIKELLQHPLVIKPNRSILDNSLD